MWHETFDYLSETEQEAKDLTVDQKLKIAEVKALLVISQELSRIHHEGINPEFSAD
jgi:hypothetical protein